MVADPSLVRVPGPWRHRSVAANGARFHVVTAGPSDDPADTCAPAAPARVPIVLLHGFPQFWYAWRHQIPALAAAGHPVIAPDLRGFAGSDKPPGRHDTAVFVDDVAGIVRALGFSGALIAGHGFGATVAWSMPALAPEVTRGIVVLGTAHPVVARRPGHLWRLRRAQASTLAYVQLPTLPERALISGGLVGRVLRAWSAPGNDGATAEEDLYTAAMGLPMAAHNVMEHFRWQVRSSRRPSGRRWLAAVDRPITVPVTSAVGALDPLHVPGSQDADAELCAGPYRRIRVAGAGHFLPEEAPGTVTRLLIEAATGH